ncbi:MAG: hypothetical protein QME59_07645 [Candidatus Hydrothermarchaeota archaeon]|nr:hypothetical protein [Candidatus Hydrothermarchaeota archaeon]
MCLMAKTSDKKTRNHRFKINQSNYEKRLKNLLRTYHFDDKLQDIFRAKLSTFPIELPSTINPDFYLNFLEWNGHRYENYLKARAQVFEILSAKEFQPLGSKLLEKILEVQEDGYRC